MAKAKLRRFGGSPVSEGVRLEVGKYTVFAVRNAQKDISVRIRREPRVFLRTLMRIPFLRGVARLLRDILRFFDGLSESTELNPQRPVRGNAFERGLARLFGVYPQTLAAWASALLIPVIVFICLYAAPEGAEAFLQQRYALSRGWLNCAVCAVRILGLLLGTACICRLRVLKRLCMYKGAMNKVINCYECRDEISVEAAAGYPVHTRRSEPAFLLSVAIVSMILFVLLPVQGVLAGAAARIAVILLTAAVLNEPFAALEGADMTLPVRITRAPIDLLQHITTLEPHPQMLEVAVCAFEAVLSDAPEEVNPN